MKTVVIAENDKNAIMKILFCIKPEWENPLDCKGILYESEGES